MLPENLLGKITPIIEKKTPAYSNLKVHIPILNVDLTGNQYLSKLNTIRTNNIPSG